MVAESQAQGVLSHHGSAENGTSHNASQHGSAKKATASVTVEAPSHISEFYSSNTLGCSDGKRRYYLVAEEF